MIIPTMKHTATTPSGHASNATSAKKPIKETAEMNMQKAGTRAEREKKK
jgi:hypothetical protein